MIGSITVSEFKKDVSLGVTHVYKLSYVPVSEVRVGDQIVVDNNLIATLVPLSLHQFIMECIHTQNGCQNNEKWLWVELDGFQYIVSVSSVLGRDEFYAFEASCYMETHSECPVWQDLYQQYVDHFVED